jgi:DNA-binding response OmpR family regulator
MSFETGISRAPGRADCVHDAMRQSVLLIEDDARIREVVERGLGARGFTVLSAAHGTAGIALAGSRPVDLVLLDLILPDTHGLRVLQAIRALKPRLPIVALTALDDMDSKLNGLDSGVDDYVTKPFSIEELAARIRARLRWHNDGVLTAGALTLELATHRAMFAGREALLSTREVSLLAAFVHEAGRTLSREELLKLVWQMDFDPGSNVVDVYVAALRRKLGADVIETVRGVGYQLGSSARGRGR